MWLSRYFVYFIIYSVMGWIYESIFCTIKSKKWENRGFLYGPMCPIYGAGGVGITAFAELFDKVLKMDFRWWQIFIISFFGSIILEYCTSWALEKLFHAYWWDYSDMPLNVNGRICLLYSCAFGVAGIIVIELIAPFTMFITSWISPIMFELFALILMGITAMDTAFTVAALTDFDRTIEELENSINQYMEEFVEQFKEKKHEMETERARIAKERLDKVTVSMGTLRQSALKRTAGFRNPKIEAGHLRDISENIRNISKKKNKKCKEEK